MRVRVAVSFSAPSLIAQNAFFSVFLFARMLVSRNQLLFSQALEKFGQEDAPRQLCSYGMKLFSLFAFIGEPAFVGGSLPKTLCLDAAGGPSVFSERR